MFGKARLCVSMALMLLLQASALIADNGDPTFDIPQLDRIMIDGKGDDWGNRGFHIGSLSTWDGKAPAPDDLDASFRLGWTEEGLLVLAEVKDDVIREGPDISARWIPDSLEIYLSDRKALGLGYRCVISPGVDSNHSEIRHHFMDILFRRVPEDLPPANRRYALRSARTTIKGGYVLEVLLPWPDTENSPGMGDRLALQLIVNDVDEKGKPFKRISWHPRDYAHEDARGRHWIRLGSEASEPAELASVALCSGNKVMVRVIAEEKWVGRSMQVRHQDNLIDEVLIVQQSGRGAAQLECPVPEVSEPWFWEVEIAGGPSAIAVPLPAVGNRPHHDSDDFWIHFLDSTNDIHYWGWRLFEQLPFRFRRTGGANREQWVRIIMTGYARDLPMLFARPEAGIDYMLQCLNSLNEREAAAAITTLLASKEDWGSPPEQWDSRTWNQALMTTFHQLRLSASGDRDAIWHSNMEYLRNSDATMSIETNLLMDITVRELHRENPQLAAWLLSDLNALTMDDSEGPTETDSKSQRALRDEIFAVLSVPTLDENALEHHLGQLTTQDRPVDVESWNLFCLAALRRTLSAEDDQRLNVWNRYWSEMPAPDSPVVISMPCLKALDELVGTMSPAGEKTVLHILNDLLLGPLDWHALCDIQTRRVAALARVERWNEAAAASRLLLVLSVPSREGPFEASEILDRTLAAGGVRAANRRQTLLAFAKGEWADLEEGKLIDDSLATAATAQADEEMPPQVARLHGHVFFFAGQPVRAANAMTEAIKASRPLDVHARLIELTTLIAMEQNSFDQAFTCMRWLAEPTGDPNKSKLCRALSRNEAPPNPEASSGAAIDLTDRSDCIDSALQLLRYRLTDSFSRASGLRDTELATALACLAVKTAGSDQESKEVVEQFEQILSTTAPYDLIPALAQLGELVSAPADKRSVLLRLAARTLEAGNFKQSLEALDRADDIAPVERDLEAGVLRGSAMVGQGRMVEAVALLKKVANWPGSDERRAKALLLAGLAQFHLGERNEALQMYRETADRFPETESGMEAAYLVRRLDPTEVELTP